MNISIGQDENVWSNEWSRLTPEQEIRIWDFYGMRQWIAKFTPRHGKTLEAGCGLGRNVFYLSKMGIDIEGVDFSKPTIEFLNEWKKKNDFSVEFKTGNVLDLEYEDNSLSGYISLGVIEHFIEGPQKALAEAYRVLRPGGIAIITTPSVSFYRLYLSYKILFKKITNKIFFKKNKKKPFYQYWYRPDKLKKFIDDSGLKMINYTGADLLFSFYEMGKNTDKYLKENSFGYKFSNKYETSVLSSLGAQSLTISVKTAEEMHCFICGELKAKKPSLKFYDAPVCDDCTSKKISEYYKKGRIAKYYSYYKINPPLITNEKRKCDFCNNEYITDELFEDYGFGKNVCTDCLKKPEVNIELSNDFVKPVWRNRIYK